MFSVVGYFTGNKQFDIAAHHPAYDPDPEIFHEISTTAG